VDLIIEPILFLWNKIFTLYYTRVRPQCDHSFLGRFVRRLEFVHPASFSHLHIWSRLSWLPKAILVNVATTLVLLWEHLESLGHHKSCIIKSYAKPLLFINQQKIIKNRPASYQIPGDHQEDVDPALSRGALGNCVIRPVSDLDAPHTLVFKHCVWMVSTD